MAAGKRKGVVAKPEAKPAAGKPAAKPRARKQTLASDSEEEEDLEVSDSSAESVDESDDDFVLEAPSPAIAPKVRSTAQQASVWHSAGQGSGG